MLVVHQKGYHKSDVHMDLLRYVSAYQQLAMHVDNHSRLVLVYAAA
jgi:hypothetical protein